MSSLVPHSRTDPHVKIPNTSLVGDETFDLSIFELPTFDLPTFDLRHLDHSIFELRRSTCKFLMSRDI